MKKIILITFLLISGLTLSQSKNKLRKENDSLLKRVDYLERQVLSLERAYDINGDPNIKQIPKLQEMIANAAKQNSIIFEHEGYMYVLDISGFSLNDIYTGDIKLVKRGDKRNWEYLLMLKSHKWTRYKL